jgi:hypothetical protein
MRDHTDYVAPFSAGENEAESPRADLICLRNGTNSESDGITAAEYPNARGYQNRN